MRLLVPAKLITDDGESVVKKAGYAKFLDPNTKQISFVKRLGIFFYPRFHIYLKKEVDKIVIDLHLDQKKPSYEGTNKHSGEYTGEKIEQELRRIKEYI